MTEKNTASKKDVIVHSKGSRESLYYVCLFASALITSVALMIYALTEKNKGLAVYSYVLIPLFFLASITTLRFYTVSINPVYTKNDALFVKKYLFTRKISIKAIDKVTVATYGNDHRTSLKVVYGEKTVKYRLKKIDKESATRLRKLGN